MKKTATAVMIGSLAAVLVACGPSEEFKASCDHVGGEVKKESEVSSILGMSSVAFIAGTPPRPPAPAPRPVVKIPSTVNKLPKANSPTLVPKAPPVLENGQMPAAAGSGKATKKSSDDDYVCVKDGKILFEEN